MSKVIPLKGSLSRNGKGSFPRIDYQTDPDYKKRFDKIFRKKKNKQ